MASESLGPTSCLVGHNGPSDLPQQVEMMDSCDTPTTNAGGDVLLSSDIDVPYVMDQDSLFQEDVIQYCHEKSR